MAIGYLARDGDHAAKLGSDCVVSLVRLLQAALATQDTATQQAAAKVLNLYLASPS